MISVGPGEEGLIIQFAEGLTGMGVWHIDWRIDTDAGASVIDIVLDCAC